MKHLYGQKSYVQSAGLINDMEIDGFAIAACGELGIELSRHRSRSFQEMQDWGDALGQFDMIVALTPASHQQALDLTRHAHTEVLFWPIMDPTTTGGNRDQKLDAYRMTRDQIRDRLIACFGAP